MAKMTNHQLELLTEVAMEQVQAAFNAEIISLKESKAFKDFAKSLEKDPYVKACRDLIKISKTLNPIVEEYSAQESRAERYIRENSDNYIYLDSYSGIKESSLEFQIQKYKEAMTQIEFKVKNWKDVERLAKRKIEQKLVVAQFSDSDMEELLAKIGKEVASALLS